MNFHKRARSHTAFSGEQLVLNGPGTRPYQSLRVRPSRRARDGSTYIPICLHMPRACARVIRSREPRASECAINSPHNVKCVCVWSGGGGWVCKTRGVCCIHTSSTTSEKEEGRGYVCELGALNLRRGRQNLGGNHHPEARVWNRAGTHTHTRNYIIRHRL